jgi:hypothetical protein
MLFSFPYTNYQLHIVYRWSLSLSTLVVLFDEHFGGAAYEYRSFSCPSFPSWCLTITSFSLPLHIYTSSNPLHRFLHTKVFLLEIPALVNTSPGFSLPRILPRSRFPTYVNSHGLCNVTVPFPSQVVLAAAYCPVRAI